MPPNHTSIIMEVIPYAVNGLRPPAKGFAMYNPFSQTITDETNDEVLVQQAQQGSRQALEQLVARHQGWIYNLAVRVVWYAHDAEDVTQEVLIKVITRIGSFKGDSRFRTWLYRIVVNHVIDMKRRDAESSELTFPAYEKMMARIEDRDIADEQTMGVARSLLVEEAKIGCTMGMLLCLDRRQRLIFILGEVFGANCKVGAEIMQISPANFRQILSRARHDLYQFLSNQCGFMNKNGRCHCHRKAWAFIEDDTVEPGKLRFAPDHLKTVRDTAMARFETLADAVEQQCSMVYRNHPFVDPPDMTATLKHILDRDDVRLAMRLDT